MCFDDSLRPARRANLPRFTAFVRLLSALVSVSMTHCACSSGAPPQTIEVGGSADVIVQAGSSS